MPSIRFDITEEESKKIMKLKGDTLKKAFAQKLFSEALRREEARQERKVK